MFDGSMTGNVTAIFLYLLFQVGGIFIMHQLLAKERLSLVLRTLLGSVLGTVMLHWFPVIFAFFFGFSKTAHILAVVLLLAVTVGVTVYSKKLKNLSFSLPAPSQILSGMVQFVKRNPIVFLMVAVFFFFYYCLLTHTIPMNEDGSIHTGQGTYGDMNMHLAFITSIANQQTFPPHYPILPHERLCYPFLCDSISSSLYLFGASLRFAYIVPMLFAVLQVFGGFYCIIKYWFQNAGTAFIAWCMFFLNSGLGFIYFTTKEDIQRNFTDFYYTPTSLGDMNMRWAQSMVNMLIPQRATLFGWAILFPTIALLLYAVRCKKTKIFAICGILGGALPMVHTHSFLSLGIICAVWLFWEFPVKRAFPKYTKWLLPGALFVGLFFFSLIQIFEINQAFVTNNGMTLVFLGLGIFACIYLYRIYRSWDKDFIMQILKTWGVLLILVLILAMPQLFIWTFSQTGNEGFLKGHFNWSNDANQYIWFYLKNLGITFIFFIFGTLCAKRKDLKIASPYLLIWYVAELITFQPNTYDNNKLLFAGFIFICGLSADCVRKLFTAKWNPIAKGLTAVVLVFIGTISALLTMGREAVSDYQLYSASEVTACRFIEQNTDPGSIFMAANNHNNAVVSLTGRNIVCGSGSILNPHGMDYTGREQDIRLFYEDPIGQQALLSKYNVDYIFVCNTERSSYLINEAAIASIADCIYAQDDVVIYQVRK